MTTSLNIQPYFDDFQASKNYVQILFRPQVPVQARELTQLQSIIKNQIAQFGYNIFKEGSKINGGGIVFKDNVDVVEISPLLNTLINAINGGSLPQPPSTPSSFIGLVITGNRTGVKARVIGYQEAISTSDTHKLLVQYISNGTIPNTDTPLTKFSKTYIEQLDTLEEDNPSLVKKFATVLEDVSVAAVVFSSPGTYFVDSNFINVDYSYKILDVQKDVTNVDVSAKIGFQIVNTFVTPSDDPTLLDNAEGTSAAGSAGAHRHQVSLFLDFRSLTSPEDQEFIELLRVENSAIVRNLSLETQYATIMDTLAQRTYDESGDYTVSQFLPTKESNVNLEKWNLIVSPGKAYVHGYKIENLDPITIEVNRARDTSTWENYQVDLTNKSYVQIDAATPLNVVDADFGTSGIVRFCNMKIADYYAGTAFWDDQCVGFAYVTSLDLAGNKLYFNSYVPVTRLTVSTSLSGIDTDTFLFAANPTTTWNNNPPVGYVVSAYTRSATNYILLSGASVSGATTLYTQSGTTVTVTAARRLSFSADDMTIITKCNADAPHASYFKAFTMVKSVFPSGDASMRWHTHLTCKTTKDNSGNIIDNNYSLLVHSSGTDLYVNTSYNDTLPTVKEHNLQNITIWTRAQNATATATPCKYGFNADDYHVYLEPETRGVLCVLESVDGNAPTGDTLALTAVTTEAHPYFPLGAKVIGQTSGAEAIVFRSNDMSSTWHADEKATNANTIEIVKIEGKFVSGEVISASVYDPDNDVYVTYSRTLTTNNFYTQTKSQDVTSRYIIDSGQESLFFGISKLIPKADATAPQKAISILFDYWKIATQRDYCSVDTYPGLREWLAPDLTFSQFDAGIIPTGIDLRDEIDFRRRPDFVWRTFTGASDTRTRYSVTSTKTPYTYVNENTSTSLTLPVLNQPFTSDIVHYLPRSDVVVLDKNGEFKVIEGDSALKPRIPKVPLNSMKIYELYSTAYTRNLEDIQIDVIDNKRYTMRDIGYLEKRIENVENAVALTALEIEALKDELDDVVIEDTAFQRLKTGIFTDAFVDYSKCDLKNPEWAATINAQWNNLLPATITDQFNLVQIAGGSGCVVKNGKAYLSYTESDYISQEKYSSSIKINPFDGWSWVGNLQITPDKDHWVDTTNTKTAHVEIDSSNNVNFISNIGSYGFVCKPVYTVKNNISSIWETAIYKYNTWGNAQAYLKDIGGGVYNTNDTSFVSPSDTILGGQNITVYDTTVSIPWLKPISTTTQNQTSTQYNIVVSEYYKLLKSVMKVRSTEITLTATELKPYTIAKVFFDGVDVTSYCKQYINNDITKGFKSSSRLKADYSGKIVAKLTLPGARFTPGSKTIVIKDVDNTTAAVSTFFSFGVNEIEDSNIVTTKSQSPQYQLIARNKYITNYTAVDPIAQTFVVKNDCFVSSIDLWFDNIDVQASRYKTPAELKELADNYGIPLNSNIRYDLFPPTGVDSTWYATNTVLDKVKYPTFETFLTDLQSMWTEKINTGFIEVSLGTTLNGSPTLDIIPESVVTLTKGVITDGYADNKAYGDSTGKQKSKVVFPSPIFLKGNVEYCILVRSPSSKDSIWTAKKGEKTANTHENISVQPYLGTLFMQQNGTLWVPQVDRDLKFILRRCSFGSSGTINLGTEISRDIRAVGRFLQGNCVKTTQGSTTVRVYHPNHCMPIGSKAEIWNVPDNGANGKFNGIPLTELNSNNLDSVSRVLHTITDRDEDWYEFTVTTAATSTGRGGKDVFATQNFQYSKFRMETDAILPINTNIAFAYKGISGQSLSEAETPYIQDPSWKVASYFDPVELDVPKLIPNENNASGKNGLTTRFTLTSESNYLSPVIDIDPLSVLCERNVLGPNTSTPKSIYINIPVTLNDSSKALRISFDYIKPSDTTMKIYYKLAYSSGWSDWIEANSITGTDSKLNWTTYTSQIDDLGAFKTFQIKVEMYSDNEAKYPRIRRLRAIATVL